MLQGVSEGEKQRFMVALEEMQMKEQVRQCHVTRTRIHAMHGK